MAVSRLRFLGAFLVGPLPLVIASALAACTPRVVGGDLAPTLVMRDVAGGTIAVQDGIPVPSFSFQPADRHDLSGAWKVQRATLDSDLSLGDRSRTEGSIVAEAGGREQPSYDDSSWSAIAVPGTFNPPPDRTQGGAWYRLRFFEGRDWRDKAVTLKFGAVNYLADVWLNGTYLGYHEGGYTPFAFDAGPAIRSGDWNVLAVRVDNPTWGTRTDIVPWGLTDWWNYGGITQPVWLEATAPLHLARVDVTPHLDGADVAVVVENRGTASAAATIAVAILPAQVNAANLDNPDPRSLLPPTLPAQIRERLGETAQPGSAFATSQLQVPALRAGESAVVTTSFLFGEADLWRPDRPALYIARADLAGADGPTDEQLETFGLRRIEVAPHEPRLLLNGAVVNFSGVAVHDDTPAAAASSPDASVSAVARGLRTQAERVVSVHASLVRTGHTPANPQLLLLADRLGFGIWEEIPLYHYTPLTFRTAMGRGIPQQMLREMALRDMNHPSVLFHGLANESTGGSERIAALQTLRDVDRSIDGTRLTGQAAYGFDPGDPTSDPLDVVGYTSYYGVFYGTDTVAETRAALVAAHGRYPTKPLMILEYGRWADPPDGIAAQEQVFNAVEGVVEPLRDTQAGGYVGAALWWTLEDYHTLRPGLDSERFGLFDASGAKRPVADLATAAWARRGPAGAPAPATAHQGIAANPPGRATQVTHGSRELVLYVLYAAAITLGGLATALLVVARPWRRRSWAS
jgi:beta-galactosidase